MTVPSRVVSELLTSRELTQAPGPAAEQQTDPPIPGTACGQTEARLERALGTWRRAVLVQPSLFHGLPPRLGKDGEMVTGTQHYGDRGSRNQTGATGSAEPLGPLCPPNPRCGPTSAACSRPVRQAETLPATSLCVMHVLLERPLPQGCTSVEGTIPSSLRASEVAWCLH